MDLTSAPIRIYHPIPPGLLDADVVKVLRHLRRYHHEAYLVGGCVRDLLLSVTPKDFDVATGALPREIQRIFRNSKVVGRRFRLAHIFFKNGKVIEVATFRRAPWSERGNDGNGESDGDGDGDGGDGEGDGGDGEGRNGCGDEDDLLITDDNLFGTPEEDARRRDFTINGLFYDLHTREIVDHVHGLPDVEARVVRAIGDPDIRIQEDPVRILRAIKFASRLELTIDPPLWQAMTRHRWEIQRSAEPRVLEEIFRLLRCNRVLAAVTLLQSSGQLEILLPEVHEHLRSAHESQPPAPDGRLTEGAERFWRLLALLDQHIGERGLPPDHVLLGVLLFLPLQQALAQTAEAVNLGKVVDELVGSVATRLRLPRRESERLRQLFITERRLAQRRHRSGRKEALLRRPCLEEALLLHELGRRLDGEPLDRVHNLREALARSTARGGLRPRGQGEEVEHPALPFAAEALSGHLLPAVEPLPRSRRRRPYRRRRDRDRARG
ncbi:MAG: CCA tRNA nucleotidyltransferase [Deltaproteobacteria bacterium]|nr:CCA tRNA nucleotidyltransferase [Deltaproteobacteria bacterium]